MAPTLEHTYAYAHASGLSASGLELATSGGAEPHLFAGWIPQPAVHAVALLVVARVARSRFHDPAGKHALADPVVTCHLDTLRFESFSSCGSAYARLDLDLAELDGEVARPGATNVDFNPPLRAELAKVGDASPLHLRIGADELAVTSERGSVVERRVPLPHRWIKGFGEVGVAQSRLEPRLELSGPVAARMLRSLPKSGPRATFHVTQAGRDARVGGVARPGSIAIDGADRVRVLDPLLRHARRLRAWGDDAGASAWVLDLRGARLHLALSSEVWRGFSGEGQVLAGLASDDLTALAQRVEEDLAWQSRLEPEALGVERAGDVLAVVAARGRAGFDLEPGVFSHRELPYDLEQVEGLHPRLAAARQLVETGGVRPEAPGVAWVQGGGGVEHRVRLEGEGVCTCPWWSRHAGARGPCKHVLAARLVLEGDARAG